MKRSPLSTGRRRVHRARWLAPALAVTATLVGGGLLQVGLPSPAVATGPTTSCNLTSNKNPSNAGETVRFRFFANSDIAPGPPGPSGLVAFFDDLDPIPFATALLTPDGPTLDRSTLFVETSSLSPGVHTIRAQIIVPNTLFGGTPCPTIPSMEQRVESAQSTTAVSASPNPSTFGQSVTFTASVTRAAGGVPQGTVQFKADGNDLGGPVGLDGSGNASVSTSTLNAGSHAITAFFASANPNTLNSNGSLGGGQTVQPAATTTSLTSALNPSESEQDVVFTAAVATVAPGAGTPVGTVQFRDGSTNLGGPTTIDPSGRAAITVATLSVGAHSVSATFTPANGNFLGSSASLNQTVDRTRTVLSYTGATTGDFHDPVTLSARLTRQRDGAPVAGKSVTLGIGPDTCVDTTNASGVASCTVTPQQPAGSHTVAAAFAGDTTTVPSSDSRAFTITREQTSLAYNGVTVIQNGGVARMSAVLTEDDGAPSIAGRSVTFTLGTGTPQTCAALTDATGRATCDITPVKQPLGPGSLTARFDQDAYYLASSASATTMLFAFPKRGAFAIGDTNAVMGNRVRFWGSQWAKVNVLTGGPAPKSFKGFVGMPGNPPQCGGTFTARSGDSDDRPERIPNYMGVLVSSRVTKDGKYINGNVVKIVVVKTTEHESSYGRDDRSGRSDRDDRDDHDDHDDHDEESTGTVVAIACG